MAQYKSYDEYLPFSPPESKPKLMEEMLRIHNEIKRIQTMTLAQLQTQVIEYHELKPSKLNEYTFKHKHRHLNRLQPIASGNL